MTPKVQLLLIQIYVHIFFLVGIYMLDWQQIISTLIICQILFAGLCGTVFYHRIVTHKNQINKTCEKILMTISWAGASGSLIAWAATHRLHHRFSDTEKDPHSPIYRNKFLIYWWASAAEGSIRLVPDLLRNQWFLFQHRYYFKILILYHVMGLTLLPLQIYWTIAIVPAFCMWFTGGMTNMFGHNKYGPTNNKILGLLTMGEGWHSNHHHSPQSVKFHQTWDLGYYLYKLLPH